MSRPDFSERISSEEFKSWYWLKEELVVICKKLNIPHTGRKLELRDRIIHKLDHPGQEIPKTEKAKPVSNFNWAKEVLGLSTKITDNISFGPNFRNFMKSQIGPKFSCHSDFMDWARTNPGKSLEDAIQVWYALEERKKDPNFKRTIAPNNMLAQYVRDFLADNPKKTLTDALGCWKLKKELPTKTGFVVYKKSDLGLG